MNTSQFIKIEAPMITQLNLKGCPLLLLALITGYTRAGKCWYGSLTYTAEYLDTSRGEIIRSLKKLTEAGLLRKYETKEGNLPRNAYSSRYDEVMAEKGGKATKPKDSRKALDNIGQYAILP